MLMRRLWRASPQPAGGRGGSSERIQRRPSSSSSSSTPDFASSVPLVLLIVALVLYGWLCARLLLDPAAPPPPHQPPPTTTISFHPVRSNTGLFVTLGSYLLLEGGGTVVVLGVGDFTPRPQPASDAALRLAPKVPGDLQCVFRTSQDGISATSPATAHVTGTAYQGAMSPSRGALYFGERLLWITCPYSAGSSPSSTSTVSLESSSSFSSGQTHPELLLAPARPEFNLTLCSSAIYGLTGSRWLIEWLEHHRANGYDAMDLYVHSVGALTRAVLDEYVQRNSPAFHVRVIDWGSIFTEFDTTQGVGRGVQSEAWEHGQRLTRNDCYLRNRGRSRWVMFSDVDELFSAASTSVTVRDVIESECETAYQQSAAKGEARKLACSFSSVTVPPNAEPEGSHERLLLERITMSEAHCQVPYNCGRYHKAREKYALRTQVEDGDELFHGPLFYHAVSRDYDLAGKHHVLVSSAKAVVRHYAGHFAHTRRGGLTPETGKWNPLPASVVAGMRQEILLQDSRLASLYRTPGQKEAFLKLDHVTDLWRFAKPGERPPPSPPPVVNKRRYLTFDYFGGRLNNQLWTLDWVMRLALSLNRTAVLGRATSREHFIGLPDSAQDGSLWDVGRLREAPFQFMFWWQVPEQDREWVLSAPTAAEEKANCVWQYAEGEKYLARWAHSGNRNEACGRRLHIASGTGLVHAYKVDTRAYGVDDALVFWRYMKLDDAVLALVRGWMKQQPSASSSSSASVGLHWRSWREAHGTQAHAIKVCGRLSDKIVSYADKHFAAECDCGDEAEELGASPAAQLWESQDWFELTCQPASIASISRYVQLPPAYPASDGVVLFVATDHETAEADRVFEQLGGHMIAGVGGQVSQLAAQYFAVSVAHQRYAKSILPILLDLALMMEVDRFVGSPASTLSHAVCLWRRAQGKHEQQPGMCQLVWWASFSDLCEEWMTTTTTTMGGRRCQQKKKTW